MRKSELTGVRPRLLFRRDRPGPALVTKWLPRYPSVPLERPWVNAASDQACQAAEDAWLATFAGANSLTKNQVNDLISWKWSGYPPGLKRSRDGVSSDWRGAAQCIRAALKPGLSSTQAIDCLREESGGIEGWKTAMSSVVLAACRPKEYTVADSRALRTVLMIGGAPKRSIDRIGWFPPARWTSYLATCLALSHQTGFSLRKLDRAFWASKGRR